MKSILRSEEYLEGHVEGVPIFSITFIFVVRQGVDLVRHESVEVVGVTTVGGVTGVVKMGTEGVEPSIPFGHLFLRQARIPIPPCPRMCECG